MAKQQSAFRNLLNKLTRSKEVEADPFLLERVISDSYTKGEKQIWGSDKTDEFNRRILAVNDMYGWLYQQGILRQVCFEWKDYSDITYFAFNAQKLAPYRTQMENSGLSDAALAVQYIFDEDRRPCLYSGAIELGWTMRTYRDFDGTVGKSWECDLVSHLDSPTVLEIEEIRERDGIQAAIHSVFEYSAFEPSDISKNGAILSVRPLEERDLASVQRFDEMSGNSVSPTLAGNDDFAWGVFKGETLVGYCTIGYAEDAYEGIVIHPGYTNDSLLISEVYICPEHRGEGCGAYLVDQVIKRRTENDKQIVLLTILDDKLSNFYEKVGFTLLNDGVMLRDERSIYDKKRDDVFEKAFSYFSSIDVDMADKRPYLYSHADKLIHCYENDELLDLLDVDCWSRFEELLGKTLLHGEYQALSAFLDENQPDGIYDPHDIDENDIKMIDQLKLVLKHADSLEFKIAEAAASANQTEKANGRFVTAER